MCLPLIERPKPEKERGKTFKQLNENEKKRELDEQEKKSTKGLKSEKENPYVDNI